MPNVITSREQADKIVEQFFQSKQTQRDFCKERSLNVGTFQWWIKRYRSACTSGKKVEAQTPFVRLKPQLEVSTTALCKESELTVDFQNGTRLKWRGNEVPSSIYQLIASLNATGGSQ
jgi:hypothetical protein